jgi:hypothetical protein
MCVADYLFSVFQVCPDEIVKNEEPIFDVAGLLLLAGLCELL